MVRRLEKQLQSHLSGRATFVEDLNVRDQLYVAFLRSPVAHARIREIDAGRARNADGLLRCSPDPTFRTSSARTFGGSFP